VRDGQLYRFEEYTDGDYEVLSAACPSVPDAVRFRSLAAFSALLYLPEPHPGVPPSAALVTVLTSRRSAEAAAGMERSCRLVTRIRGSILLADKNALINSLRHEDTPMHFYTKLEDFPGYIGAGPRKRWISPSPAVRANH